MNSGLVFIVSSASGVGKTTLCRMLKEKYSQISESISVTTRSKRETERDKVEYFFVSEGEFENLIREDKFVEYAKVYGNYYGTLKSEVDKIITNDQIPLFDIDWQGARQVRDALQGYNIVTVYLLPPSVQTVYNRLHNRNSDNEEIIDNRMNLFFEDIKHAKEYDYVVINNKLDEAFRELSVIYEAGYLKGKTVLNTEKLVTKLLKEKYQK